MKATLNVIRVSLAGSICISLLAACDGRGATAFKAYQHTPEQIKEYQQKLERERLAKQGGSDLPALDPNGINMSPDAPKSTIFEPAPSELPPTPSTPAPSTGPADQTTPPAPEGSDVPKEEGKATLDPSSKFFVEFGKLEEEQRRIAKRDKLVALVDEKVKGSADARAAAMLNEISFSRPDSKSLTLSLKAALTMAGQERFLFVEGAPIGYDKDGDVIPLDSELHETREMNGNPVLKGDSIYAMAFCPTADCKFIQVLFDFAGNTERVYAVFILEVKSDGYKIVAHNLGSGLKEFSEVSTKEGKAEEKSDLPTVTGGEVNKDEALAVKPSTASTAIAAAAAAKRAEVAAKQATTGPLAAADKASAAIGQQYAATKKAEVAAANTNKPAVKPSTASMAIQAAAAQAAAAKQATTGPLAAADKASAAIGKQYATTKNAELAAKPSTASTAIAAAKKAELASTPSTASTAIAAAKKAELASKPATASTAIAAAKKAELASKPATASTAIAAAKKAELASKPATASTAIAAAKKAESAKKVETATAK